MFTTQRVFTTILALIVCVCAGCRTRPDSIAIPPCGDAAIYTADAKEASEERVIQILREIIIPEMSFRPPATIIDAVDFFKQASRDYHKPDSPYEQRGISLALKLSPMPSPPFSPENISTNVHIVANSIPSSLPQICAVTARFINMYDAIKLVCDVTGMKLRIRNNIIMIVPLDDPDSELLTRSYYVPPSLCCERIPPAPDEPPMSESQRLKEFYACLGVGWPNGSSISSIPSFCRWLVTNTQDNHDRLRKILDETACRPKLVDTELQILAFRTADIERLQRIDGVSLASLNALREKGKAKPVAIASGVTKSGQETIIKAVKEMIFPTEFNGMVDGGTNLNPTVDIVLPSNFETREVGIVLQLVAEAREGGLIELMLNPQWTTLDGWERYDAGIPTRWGLRKLSLRQPVFNCTSWQTQVTMKVGETILLGGVATSDGKWVHYGFLRASTQTVEAETWPW